MAYELVIYKGQLKTDNSNFISITKSHIRFSTSFVRNAKISPIYKVKIYKDDVEHKLKFEFSKDITENCLTLTEPKDRKSLKVSAHSLYKKINWLRAFANNGGKERRIIPQDLTGKVWEISLRPSFESVISKIDLQKKSLNTKGIYRYKNHKGEIIYIGKGDIKHRFLEPQRKNWDIDIIEYSEINENENQLKWESYWIQDYMKNNNDNLPQHNNIKGRV